VRVYERGASVYDSEKTAPWGEVSANRAEIIRTKHKGK